VTRSEWRTSRPPPILRVSFVAVPFRRPFSVPDPHQPGRAATPLELFFNLIFVVAIASNVVQLHHGITEGTVGVILAVAVAIFLLTLNGLHALRADSAWATMRSSVLISAAVLVVPFLGLGVQWSVLLVGAVLAAAVAEHVLHSREAVNA